MLKHHDRFPYHPWVGRPRWSWPNGAKLALYLGVNLEHFSFGEGLGAELVPGPNTGGGPQPDILNYAWREYGNRVGAWRLLALLDELRLPATVLLNSAMLDHAPTLVAAHAARGDELAGHGRTNAERQSTMAEAEERALIEASTTAIQAAGYPRPRGWLSPWIAESHVTPDLLAEAGYGYSLNWCHDDMPVWKRTRAKGEGLGEERGRGQGRILSIPYPQEANDIPAIVARKDGAQQFADMLVADFEERLDQVSDGIAQVMGVALHPYIIGQPYRMRALRGALARVLERRDEVWVCTAGAIHDHVLTLPEGSIPQ